VNEFFDPPSGENHEAASPEAHAAKAKTRTRTKQDAPPTPITLTLTRRASGGFISKRLLNSNGIRDTLRRNRLHRQDCRLHRPRSSREGDR
jgi:hypothetical protein